MQSCMDEANQDSSVLNRAYRRVACNGVWLLRSESAWIDGPLDAWGLDRFFSEVSQCDSSPSPPMSQWGSFSGSFSYAAMTRLWPSSAHPVLAALIILAAVVIVLFRSPNGTLAPRRDRT